MNHYEEEAEENLHASVRQVLRGAIETGHLEQEVGAEMARALEADARALWAVRVLDRWYAKRVAANPDRGGCAPSPEIWGDGWCVDMSTLRGQVLYTGATPDAARIAAAEALVAEDPTLGEDL